MTESKASEIWLIPSNPFDLIGARNTGLSAAWVRRLKDVVFDPCRGMKK